MGFDWKKFTGGVLSGVAADIRERRDDAKEYEEEQEELAERNIPRVQKKQMLANEAAQLGLRARALGATDAQISNALSSGVNGIKDFHDKLQAAAQDAGVKTLGKADIDALVNMPNIPNVDFKFADDEYQDFVEKTYGLGTPKVVRPEEEDNLLRTFFALDAKDRAKARLADRELFEGMTVAEINAAARDAEYESLFPESTMTFSDINFFGPKDLRQFTRDIETGMAKAGTTDRDELIIENAKAAAREKYMKDNNITQLTADQATEINNKAAANALTLLQQDAAKIDIENALDTYHRPDLLTDPAFKRIVIAAMGEPYFNSLLEEEGMLEKDFGIETEDIPFSDISGFTGDAEADEEFRRQREEQEDQQEQPSTQENQTQEDSQTETSDTEAKKEALLAETYPKRPSGFGNLSGKGEWDRKYEGKVNPETGKAIIAPPRPDDGGDKTKELPITVGILNSPTGRMKKVTEAEYWDAMYGDTHDPITGIPIGLED